MIFSTAEWYGWSVLGGHYVGLFLDYNAIMDYNAWGLDRRALGGLTYFLGKIKQNSIPEKEKLHRLTREKAPLSRSSLHSSVAKLHKGKTTN